MGSNTPFQTIESFLEAPVCVGFRDRTMWQWSDDCRLVIREDGVAERVLTVGLFLGGTVADGKCCHQMDYQLGHDRCLTICLGPVDSPGSLLPSTTTRDFAHLG
jgi:hypothetical protein